MTEIHFFRLFAISSNLELNFFSALSVFSGVNVLDRGLMGFRPCGIYHQTYSQDHAWWQTKFVWGKMIFLFGAIFYLIPQFAGLYLISVANVIGYTILLCHGSPITHRLLRSGHFGPCRLPCSRGLYQYLPTASTTSALSHHAYFGGDYVAVCGAYCSASLLPG